MPADPAQPHRPRRFAGASSAPGRPCAEAGCGEPGEYRAPRRADTPGEGRWRYLCLTHVRAFNASYDYFDGMDADAIYAEQHPLHGWADRTSWADGGSPPPKWQDFADPIDAIGARFKTVRDAAQRAAQAGLSAEDSAALKTLGLDAGADRSAIRRAYAAKLRQFHPDRNGGDRRHEAALRKVVAAYQRLKASRTVG